MKVSMFQCRGCGILASAALHDTSIWRLYNDEVNTTPNYILTTFAKEVVFGDDY